jgi:membrane associated rhomboid family serine protease
MAANDWFRVSPLTLVLIAISVIVTLLTKFGANRELVIPLLMVYDRIAAGEIWRIITPIFIHFGLLHIVFNMLWLYDLGGMVEIRQGSPRLGILVGVSAVVSNIAQYMWAGPWFGGMSGVVYALLGYVWAQGQFNPRSGMILHQTIVIMMLIWFVVCWMGLVGNIANMAHTLGLVSGVGLGWAYSPAGLQRGGGRRM